jgi:hypothetical protein
MRFALILIALFAGFATAARAEDHPAYGGPGDSGFRDVCPEHNVIVGFKRRMGTLTDQITTICAALRSDDTTGEPTTPFTPHGGNGGAPRTVACNSGSGVKEIAIYFTGDKRRIATLAYDCRPQVGVIGRQLCMADASGAYCGRQRELTGVNLSGDDPIVQSCDRGEWAVGIHGRSGKHLNAIGLICAKVEPVFIGIDVRTTPSKVITNNAVEKPFEDQQFVDAGKIKKRGNIYTAPPVVTPLPAQPTPLPPATPQDPATGGDDFDGTWATVTASGSRYTMKLNQTRRRVRGAYQAPSGATGTIEGKVRHGVLTYRWEEGGNEGTGRFELSADGQTFTGWWNSTDNPNDVEGTWTGTRK